MFKVNNGKLRFEDSEYALPKEVANLQPKQVYGTATAGLDRKRGIIINSNGLSATVVVANNESVAGHIIGDVPKIGTLVYLREQLDPNNPSKVFWLVSLNEIKNNLNWLNVEFITGENLVLCPFTLYYKVEKCR